MVENIEIKTKITDLNTECFIEIGRNLDWKDLYRLKLTHSAFGHAVDYLAKTSEFDFMVTTTSISEFEGFVEVFGKELKYLNIRFNGEWTNSIIQRIELLIGIYCANGNIKRCLLDGFKLRKSFFMRNISFFNVLESLKLLRSTELIDIDWLMEFVATSKNIKEFYLTCNDGECNGSCDVLHRIASSKLEICGLNFNSPSDLTREVRILPMNYTLKVLNLAWSQCDPVALTHFPNIECIKRFLQSDYSLNPILTLPALKTFELCLKLDTETLSFLTRLAD